MPNINGYNGIDMANIASINGKDIPAASSGGYTTGTSGLLLWGYDGAPGNPIPPDLMTGVDVPSSFQVWAGSSYEVKKIGTSRYGTYVLDTNGDLYTAAIGSSYSYIGRNSGTGSSQAFILARTGVDDIAVTLQGCITIESGSMYWTGANMRWYIGVTTSSYSTWTRYGTDTDWISVEAHPGYPYGIAALKGSSSTTAQLYVSGYNQYGRTGLGTTAGQTMTPTIGKINSTTNFTDYVAQVSIGVSGIGVITQDGKFFTTGRGLYGANGNGSSSDISYFTQVGTDTDWEFCTVTNTAGFAIKGGQLYASSSSAFYHSITNGMTANRTYQLIDSDTDWEIVRGYPNQQTYDYDFKGVIFKKNGEWGICGQNAGWNGDKADSATSAGFTSFKNSTAITNSVGSTKTIDQANFIYNDENPALSAVGIILHVR
jgi:hypothetical protein